MVKSYSAVLLLVALTACSQRYMVSDDLSYAYNLPPVGSTLKLLRPLEIPAGETRIFLQNGKAMRKSAFDRYKPSCSLEVRKLSDQSREVEPGSFRVSRVQRLTQEVVGNDEPASGWVKVSMEEVGMLMVVRGYHLWLDSQRQPDVMRMTCRGAFDNNNRALPPSLQQVKKSLGNYAELDLAT